MEGIGKGTKGGENKIRMVMMTVRARGKEVGC